MPSFDLSSARKLAEGIITALIARQIIIHNALSKDVDSVLTLNGVCVCVCVFVCVCMKERETLKQWFGLKESLLSVFGFLHRGDC